MIQARLRRAILPAFPGVTVIMANQNGPRPAAPYAVLRIETARRLPVHTGAVDDDGNRAVEAIRTGQCEVQMFGPGAYEALDLALQRLSHETCMDAADAEGVTFGDVHEINDLPVLRDASTYEPRAVSSFDFSYVQSTEEFVSWIETVEGTGKLEGPAIQGSFEFPYSATIADNS